MRLPGLIPRSLAFRVIAFSTIWAIAALVVIATIISTLFRDASERGFESLLSAHLFNLISSVGVDDAGNLTGAPNLGDRRFVEPGSGWYWSVIPVTKETHGELSSISLNGEVAAPTVEEVPFGSDVQRRYFTTGPAGEELEVLESEFSLDSHDRAARFRMMGNRSEFERDITAFDRKLYTYLALFGLGMIGINAVAIMLGLQPLNHVRQALAAIRQGTAQRLDGEFPNEIAPLAEETNALIESNRRIIERARTQVGNLAHSLKTPLAVLLNEGRALGNGKGRLIVEQAGAMQQQLEHYLQRARIAAQRDSVVYRTPTREALQRLVRVFRKVDARIELEFAEPDREVIFAGEREDFEEIVGNLLENAMKWARTRARVGLAEEAGIVLLTIEDDGPGIPEDKAREALARGKRLDESKPGTGLGLSIVNDLVREYGGELKLLRSDLGGLKAEVRLPGPG
jgi:signal transduction histidine kinase